MSGGTCSRRPDTQSILRLAVVMSAKKMLLPGMAALLARVVPGINVSNPSTYAFEVGDSCPDGYTHLDA